MKLAMNPPKNQKAHETGQGVPTLRVAVVGLGYVGLPLAIAFANTHADVAGFDVSVPRIKALRDGIDETDSIENEELAGSSLKLIDHEDSLESADFFIVAVPTPVDVNKQPDLSALKQASEIVGKKLKKNGVVVYESTVYPGVTEEICGPILEKTSGLVRGVDFKIGYSPERINPGDSQHTLSRIVKVVSGEDEEVLERIAELYESIIEVGVYRAPSIKVAEAAKVIENTQRDLNIALMNELAIIFDRMDIRTRDVLATAETKWNFLPFKPGLVGGHCICVDPYYLTMKAESLGYHPQVILAGRRINDGMGAYVAQRFTKLLVQAERPIKSARIGILGITFKEDVGDIRHSQVVEMMSELRDFGMEPMVHDPLADSDDVRSRYGTELHSLSEFVNLDGVIFAVPHKFYVEKGTGWIRELIVPGGVIVDVKSVLDENQFNGDCYYWCL